MRRIVYISGTRADYGLMRSTLRAIGSRPGLALSVVATGMHLMPEFGRTIDEIRRDGFAVQEIDATYERDDPAAMAEFIGNFTLRLARAFRRRRPDIILVLGDRGEMLAAAAVGQYLGIPVAHIHGGDVTSTVDEPVRHAITKLAHLHFAATKESARRIIRMGEERRRVFVVGAPGLDEIRQLKIKQPIKQPMTKEELGRRLAVKLPTRFAIVLQHPVSDETGTAAAQMRTTLDGVLAAGIPAFVIYPNADAGGRAMIKAIKAYEGRILAARANVPHEEFLGLMRHATVMIGNSSAGIIESSSFKLPIVNVGTRQEGRQRAVNVIDVGHDAKKIEAAVRKALSDERFRRRLSLCRNPYGDGKTGERIARMLSSLKIDETLLQKKLTY